MRDNALKSYQVNLLPLLFGKLALYGVLVPLVSGLLYSLLDELISKDLLGEIRMLGNGPIYEAPIEWILKVFEFYTIGFYIYVLLNRYVTLVTL